SLGAAPLGAAPAPAREPLGLPPAIAPLAPRPALDDDRLPEDIWDQILAENASGPISVAPLGRAIASDAEARASRDLPHLAPALEALPTIRMGAEELPGLEPPAPRVVTGHTPAVSLFPYASSPSPRIVTDDGLPPPVLGPREVPPLMPPTPLPIVRGRAEPPPALGPREVPPLMPPRPTLTREDFAGFFDEPSESASPDPRAAPEEPKGAPESRWEPAPIDVETAAWALGQMTAVTDPSMDALDFASDAVETGDIEDPARRYAHTPSEVLTPWDDGPSRTAPVELGHEAGHDAVPEPTPLPEFERDFFFGRNTGDQPALSEPSKALVAPAIPAARASTGRPGPDIFIDEPVELPVERPRPSASWAEKGPELQLREAKDRFHLHDFSGAVDLLELLKPGDPGFEEARALLAEARANLMRMYESKLGDIDAVPRLLISNEEVIWLNLNHRAGFILSQIDGSVSYDDIIALSGMPRLDTLKILSDLISNKVIG
ncbi:hypothetical protein L6R52_31205, partial [Myxococcota bacterium]|nr:hypothetical protein [Myxococcota bacterium]